MIFISTPYIQESIPIVAAFLKSSQRTPKCSPPSSDAPYIRGLLLFPQNIFIFVYCILLLLLLLLYIYVY